MGRSGSPTSSWSSSFSEVARLWHLRFHRVDGRKAEIVIDGPAGAFSDAGIERTSAIFGVTPEFFER